jgi:hypothetical protein
MHDYNGSSGQTQNVSTVTTGLLARWSEYRYFQVDDFKGENWLPEIARNSIKRISSLVICIKWSD